MLAHGPQAIGAHQLRSLRCYSVHHPEVQHTRTNGSHFLRSRRCRCLRLTKSPKVGRMNPRPKKKCKLYHTALELEYNAEAHNESTYGASVQYKCKTHSHEMPAIHYSTDSDTELRNRIRQSARGQYRCATRRAFKLRLQ